ncbi:MAG: NAD(P)H-dependent oxidoreductase subunit E [Peptococcaceae bacterium]|nr:NAD(P)H-dependent oxidoreductase subunit E [Peptococcaceae bacterium]
MQFVVQEIVGQMGSEKAPLLQVLLAVQDASPQNYVSEEAVKTIARAMKVSRCRVYSTASFYSEISLKPRGRHLIRICGNAPCENAGMQAVLEAIQRELAIEAGQTTQDGLISLEKVSCLGACYKSPAIKVDHQVYGNLTPEAAVSIIRGLKEAFGDGRSA